MREREREQNFLITHELKCIYIDEDSVCMCFFYKVVKHYTDESVVVLSREHESRRNLRSGSSQYCSRHETRDTAHAPTDASTHSYTPSISNQN